MNIKNSAISTILKQNRLGLYVFFGLVLVTLAMLFISQRAQSLSQFIPVLPSDHAVQLSAKLSQTKLIQGEQQTVYLDVGIKTPVTEITIGPEQATDMVIVLDRSGSMSGARKMDYAKAAIRDVLTRLNAEDRFALISFSDNTIVHSALINVDTNNNKHLNNLVNNIAAGGGTNMEAGLKAALTLFSNTNKRRLLSENSRLRSRKVLLLSDGHANQGITDPSQLATIAGAISETGSVVSTIGMGIDFNETLMAKLADHGMGHYAYLEDLSGLATILARDLQQTRNTYANSSQLDIQLADGVRIIDAGGYPISNRGANTVRIITGQLLANANKNLVITFGVSTQNLGNLSLGNMQLLYQHQDVTRQTRLDDKHLQLAVLKAEFKEEVVHSIAPSIYQKSWLKNNLGRMQKQLSELVRAGDKDEAKKVIGDYRQNLSLVGAQSNVPMASAAMDDKLDRMEAEVDEAFAGSRSDQQVKRKRVAKSMQYGGIKEQRSIK